MGEWGRAGTWGVREVTEGGPRRVERMEQHPWGLVRRTTRGLGAEGAVMDQCSRRYDYEKLVLVNPRTRNVS